MQFIRHCVGTAALHMLGLSYGLGVKYPTGDYASAQSLRTGKEMYIETRKINHQNVSRKMSSISIIVCKSLTGNKM